MLPLQHSGCLSKLRNYVEYIIMKVLRFYRLTMMSLSNHDDPVNQSASSSQNLQIRMLSEVPIWLVQQIFENGRTISSTSPQTLMKFTAPCVG